MIATHKIDTTDFNRSLKEYIPHNRRDLAEVINIKMFFILKRARQLTPIADRQEILADMGAEDVFRTSKKTGLQKRSFGLTKGRANPFKILAHWAKKKGWDIPYEERRKAARKLIGRRLSAVGVLRKGWNLSLKKFAAAAKQAFDVGPGRVKAKGSAKVAVPGWNPVALAEYALAIKKGDADFRIDPRVEAALGQAFAEEAQSMREYIAKKMQARIDATK